MYDLKGKRLVVVGLGKSGISAARMALARGAEVVCADMAQPAALAKAQAELQSLGVAEFCFGDDYANAFKAIDWVVVSPGVGQFDAIEAAEAAGAAVMGELEFAWLDLQSVPTLAVGGTNGKSTTTELLGALLSARFDRVFVGGNLGTAACDAALEHARQPYDAVVFEVSSFQAERMSRFAPQAAALLNIRPDHLDRYRDFEHYAASKGRMVTNMSSESVLVLPHAAGECGPVTEPSQARRTTFGEGGDVQWTDSHLTHPESGWSFPLSQLRLVGSHNYANVAAASLMARAVGVEWTQISEVLQRFEGLAHRCQLVASVEGVRFIDDSKGTNVAAARTAVESVPAEKVVWIGGGRDKLGSYEPLRAALAKRGRAAVLIGEAADRLAESLAGSVPIERATDMDDAVAKGQKLAHFGDAVLLSPACSSFDMFKNYKVRGEAFVAAVQRLAGKGSQ